MDIPSPMAPPASPTDAFDLAEVGASSWLDPGGLRHAERLCARPQLRHESGALGQRIDPASWCGRCSGVVTAMLRAWGQPGARPAGGLLLVEVPHPALQEPGVWVTRALAGRRTVASRRGARVVAPAAGRGNRWVSRLGDSALLASWGLGLVALDPVAGPDQAIDQVARLWGEVDASAGEMAQLCRRLGLVR